MKFISFEKEGLHQVGLVHNDMILSLTQFFLKERKDLPATLEKIIELFDHYSASIRQIDQALKNNDFQDILIPIQHIQILPPIKRPASCRDAYAFRQHVEAARRNRNVPMIPEFDQFPVFYFTNHHSIIGPGPVKCMEDHFDKLDFELEVAVVIGRKGRNVKAVNAENLIFGYTILNDWSARTLQMEEMLLSLGPAKGKDFANAIGPILVTPDELADVKTNAPQGHIGNNYNLNMLCRVNGKEVSRGNMKDMDWTFAEIIERAAYGVDLHPTDLIGSGTVGTGCLLEINGTHKRLNPDYQPWWLKEGDVVELEIDRLGILSNTVVKEDTASLLKHKHAVKAD